MCSEVSQVVGTKNIDVFTKFELFYFYACISSHKSSSFCNTFHNISGNFFRVKRKILSLIAPMFHKLPFCHHLPPPAKYRFVHPNPREYLIFLCSKDTAGIFKVGSLALSQMLYTPICISFNNVISGTIKVLKRLAKQLFLVQSFFSGDTDTCFGRDSNRIPHSILRTVMLGLGQ